MCRCHRRHGPPGSNIVIGSYASDAKIKQVEFLKSSARARDCLEDERPEFAIVRRSNVSKFSLINSLVKKKEFGLTSKKPGSPTAVNLDIQPRLAIQPRFAIQPRLAIQPRFAHATRLAIQPRFAHHNEARQLSEVRLPPRFAYSSEARHSSEGRPCSEAIHSDEVRQAAKFVIQVRLAQTAEPAIQLTWRAASVARLVITKPEARQCNGTHHNGHERHDSHVGWRVGISYAHVPIIQPTSPRFKHVSYVLRPYK